MNNPPPISGFILTPKNKTPSLKHARGFLLVERKVRTRENRLCMCAGSRPCAVAGVRFARWRAS